MQLQINLIYLSRENDRNATFCMKFPIKKYMKGLYNETDFFRKGLKCWKHLVNINQSIRWNELKKTAIIEKIPSTKFWIIYKSKFDQKYLENEKRFWHTVFFSWSVLFFSTFWPKMSKIVRVVLEKSRKNLIFWYKIAYKKKLGIFSGNRALSLLSLYHCLTS